ncbi:hypothetical protein CYMTET_27618 [Cymbomonas tetramitiformis]|uniref:Sister chromatid cohesion protein DCC1 n=1 Tax=Cymbomonas tetramitiformis TaxID=36881 RepID=A0AAE0FR13_9CHLO|nr:hypothetical protein CYMTET_27618 [Cymbomonas tetramitiformis]
MSAVSSSWPITLQPGQSSKLVYGPDFGLNQVKLLEVDENMLDEIVGNRVVIKGGMRDEAVLCTERKTYQLKSVDNSNTILLVPPKEHGTSGDEAAPALNGITHLGVKSQGQEPGLMSQRKIMDELDCGQQLVATTSVSTHMEMVHISPQLTLLIELLQQCPLTEKEALGLVDEAMELDGMVAPPKGYTFEDLNFRVQVNPRTTECSVPAAFLALLKERCPVLLCKHS